MLAAEGLVVAAVVAAAVGDAAKQFVLVLVEQAAEGQLLGKGDLGRVLLRHLADAVDGAREVDGENLGEDGQASRLGNLALGGVADVAEVDVLGGLLRIQLDGGVELVDALLGVALEGVRGGAAHFVFQVGDGVDEAALFALEVVNVLGLEDAVEAGVERRRRLLWHGEGDCAKVFLARLGLVAARLAFELGFVLALHWEAIFEFKRQ